MYGYRYYTAAEVIYLQQQHAQQVGQVQGYTAAIHDVADAAYLARKADRRYQAREQREMFQPTNINAFLPDRSRARSRVEALPPSATHRARSVSRHTSRFPAAPDHPDRGRSHVEALPARAPSRSRHTSRFTNTEPEARRRTQDGTVTTEDAYAKYLCYQAKAAELSEALGKGPRKTRINELKAGIAVKSSKEYDGGGCSRGAKSGIDEWSAVRFTKPKQEEGTPSRGHERVTTVYPGDSISRFDAPPSRAKSQARWICIPKVDQSAAKLTRREHERGREELRRRDYARDRLEGRHDKYEDPYYPSSPPPRSRYRAASPASHYPPAVDSASPRRNRGYSVREMRPSREDDGYGKCGGDHGRGSLWEGF